MNGEMTKERLLGLERAARQEWEALLDQVGEARMTVPAINNGWSLKDAVAHISYYLDIGKFPKSARFPVRFSVPQNRCPLGKTRMKPILGRKFAKLQLL